MTKTKTLAALRPFFAVRVEVTHDDGSTTTRDFVRRTARMSKSDFASFAVGDLLRMTQAQGATWTVEEVDPSEVH
jgi:hypothetical protein